MPVRAEDPDEPDERLAVGLQRRTHDELARAVVAAADRAELHAGDVRLPSLVGVPSFYRRPTCLVDSVL